MENFNLLNLLIVSTAVTLFVQVVKARVTNDTIRYGIFLATSLIAATVYHFIKDTPYWPTLISILTIASGILVILIKPAERIAGYFKKE